MANESKNRETNEKKSQISIPLVISAAVGVVAVVAIVLAIVLGGGKNNGASGGSSDPSDGAVDFDGDGEIDNIDPDGWTKVDK